MKQCKLCGSFAVNERMHGREKGIDLDLCDVCYWRTRATALASAPAVPQAAVDVLAERERQKSQEGWTAQHDDEHDTGELADAAAVYALRSSGHFESGVPSYWPWDAADYRPKGRRRNLVRAGALILAEIERLDRAAAKGEKR